MDRRQQMKQIPTGKEPVAVNPGPAEKAMDYMKGLRTFILFSVQPPEESRSVQTGLTVFIPFI